MTATAFDHLGDSDLDSAATVTGVHPFQARGLGAAPFACTGFEQGEGDCAYCGKMLKNLFHIKSADSRTFVVGSDCVAKTNAILGGYDQYKSRFDKAQRERRKIIAATKREQQIAAGIELFKSSEPEVYEWMRNGRGGFADAMMRALNQWGSLTPNQLDASKRSIESAKEWAAKAQTAREQRQADAPVVDLSPIEASFAKAKAKGLRRPSITLAGFKLRPAGAQSANAGAIYITRKSDDTYLGKVMGGKLFKSRECDDDMRAAIVKTCQDPLSAAIAYGKQYGICCVCSRELTDPKSIERGIGPICEAGYF